MALEKRRDLARHCFGCGKQNPYGLRLHFRPVEAGVEAEFTPRQEHQGFPGVLHGGITATVLDEAMAWAVYACGIMAFTARMETRFRQSIPVAEPLKVIGELIQDRGRFLRARAEIRTFDGELLADAEGLFLRMPEATIRELERLATDISPG